MPHDQVIALLEPNIIFLLLTNAVSVAVAACAISAGTGRDPHRREANALVMSKANAVLTAMWPSSTR
jgi:hypothetical protein